MKIKAIITSSLLIASAFTSRASSPSFDIFLMDDPLESVVQVSAAGTAETLVYVADNRGTYIFSDRISSSTASSRTFDFSKIGDGNYTIVTKSDFADITKKIAVENAEIEVLSKETEFKPVFEIKDDILKINFLNQSMEDIEITIEDSNNIYYEEMKEGNFNFGAKLDLRNLFPGEYTAKIEANGNTYYHYFRKF